MRYFIVFCGGVLSAFCFDDGKFWPAVLLAFVVMVFIITMNIADRQRREETEADIWERGYFRKPAR